MRSVPPIVAVALLCACPHAPVPTAAPVGGEWLAGLVEVPGRLGDLDARFLVDTGAGMTVITPPIRDRLGIPADSGARVTAQGIGGEAGEVRIVQLPPLTVGGTTIEGLSAVVIDLSVVEDELGRPLEGILGRNFFARCDVDLDLAAPSAAFYPRGRAPVADGLVEVPFVLAGGLPQVPMGLEGGAQHRVTLDLGSTASSVTFETASAAGSTHTPSEGPAEHGMLGADGNPVPADPVEFGQLSLGDLVFERPTLLVCRPGGCDRSQDSLGIDLLQGRRVIVSYDRRRLWISP